MFIGSVDNQLGKQLTVRCKLPFFFSFFLFLFIFFFFFLRWGVSVSVRSLCFRLHPLRAVIKGMLHNAPCKLSFLSSKQWLESKPQAASSSLDLLWNFWCQNQQTAQCLKEEVGGSPGSRPLLKSVQRGILRRGLAYQIMWKGGKLKTPPVPVQARHSTGVICASTLAIGLSKQRSPRNWNFPRNLMLARGKGWSLVSAKRRGLSDTWEQRLELRQC